MARQCKRTLDGMRDISYYDFFTDSLPTYRQRIIVRYTWWFVGNSGFQCFTSGTWIGGPPLHGDFPECVKVCPTKRRGEYRRYVGGFTARHWSATDSVDEFFKYYISRYTLYIHAHSFLITASTYNPCMHQIMHRSHASLTGPPFSYTSIYVYHTS